MACCGLCRSKVKPPVTKSKNITPEIVNTIEMWIENIEGPYDTIDLPLKPSDGPIILTSKAEITEVPRNQNMNKSCISINRNMQISQHLHKTTSANEGLQSPSPSSIYDFFN